jgi:ribosomal protein L12E/L44/L45/RPP1/RPP2
MDANDTRHIWLRQTVTFTVDGQTRTLEVGIPVPHDATAQDVEALLGVAEIGMSALSRRLDARIAEALGDSSDSIPALPAAIPETHAANGFAPMERVDEVEQVNNHLSPVAEPPVTHPREAKTESAPHIATAPTPAAPRPSKPAVTPERPAPPQRSAEPPRTQPPAAASSSVTVTDAGGEMTRQQFLAAVAALGLNPRQAMDQLGVRSLEGLNLREALESLRRQLLGASSPTEQDSEPEPEDISAVTAAASLPRQFEEEDDETILYALDDDEELDEDGSTVSASGGAVTLASEDTLDDLDLDEEDEEDDVPDLTPPPARQRASATTRKAPTTVRETPTPASDDAPTSSTRTQAMRLIGKLRSATGGGTASDYQRNAYRNIVENELGKSKATMLVRGLWRTTGDRLTAGQLDALIRWGKEDVFADEAIQVLSALQEEQRRAAQEEAAAASADEPTQARTTARGRPAGGAR